MSETSELLAALQGKDTKAAYQTLLALERMADETDALYPYTEQFVQMAQSDRYAVRVRGFRLFCRQAKWDTGLVVNQNLSRALSFLSDEKPTAVRQALAALYEVARYKPALRGQIRQAIDAIDLTRYKDTVRGLIAKDVRALSERMDAL
jgi:hypothetical protein